MSQTALSLLIEKLANSQNPVIQGLGDELRGLQPLVQASPHQVDDKNYSVDTDLSQGTETEHKSSDEIDSFLSSQMPELQQDDNADVQPEVANSNNKIATYRDLLRAHYYAKR